MCFWGLLLGAEREGGRWDLGVWTCYGGREGVEVLALHRCFAKPERAWLTSLYCMLGAEYAIEADFTVVE